MGRRTLVVESVDTVDTRTLVVAAEDEEVFGIFDLVRQEQADRLKTLLATVNIVSKEKVVSLWWEAAVLKEPQQVVILPVYIAW